jgi:hypothetical protein
MAREAQEIQTENLGGAWKHVTGVFWLILADLDSAAPDLLIGVTPKVSGGE